MTQMEQKKAAKKFVQNWAGHGYEKGETQKFWIDLLTTVFGVTDIPNFVYFEEQVKNQLSGKAVTNFIDVYIPSTLVMIEQKSSNKDLRSPIKQSDGSLLTPFQQAKKYVADLPRSLHPKWIITCNFDTFLIYNMEQPNSEPEEILLKDLEKEFTRLSFLVNAKNIHIKKEMEISIKAGDIVGQLYDKLLAQYKLAKNVDMESCFKSLNMLCVRLVFCLYAEDAGIFGHKSMFGDYLNQFPPQELRRALLALFKVLDQKLEEREPFLEDYLAQFPYVNGGLFTEQDQLIPPFTQEIKDLLVSKASEDFDWSQISPTIFGAVFESTLNPETRRKGGMHYTSIENIHKVIDPLFLNNLYNEFEEICQIKAVKQRNSRLIDFQKKLGTLTFLDPACGSGNFLTETYLSLRRLENKAIRMIIGDANEFNFDDSRIYIHISQFYGIEINDFAVTVAKTALWIAESQMMKETSEILGHNLEFLPLKTNACIVEGNALHMDWSTLQEELSLNAVYAEKLNIYKVDEVPPAVVKDTGMPDGSIYKELNVIAKDIEQKELPNQKDTPVLFDYIMGNPPFVGYGLQSQEQKRDTLSIYRDEKGNPYKTAGKIDYVANWYLKAAQLIYNTNTKCAFVSTNSITQGEQVSSVWKPIFERFNIHIDYAYQTFRWDSESSLKAHVHCVIVGFSSGINNSSPKIYINNSQVVKAKNISPYLIDSPTVWIESRTKPLCNVPFMTTGNRPADGGHLIIETNEYDDFIKKEPNALKYIKKLTGSEEYINNKLRYCLWLVGVSPGEIRNMPEVYKRVLLCREDRLNGAPDRQKLADTPAVFREINNPEKYIIVPRVSSETRRYIPLGFLDDTVIPTDSAVIISNATLYEFGILTSNVHMAWMRAVCGRLKSDYRYSKDIVYNNFPWPNPTEEQKTKIEQTAQTIFDARSKYPDSSLADLYDEALMPPDLRKAHRDNDRAVMQAYGFDYRSMTESECVSELFKLYQKLVSK